MIRALHCTSPSQELSNYSTLGYFADAILMALRDIGARFHRCHGYKQCFEEDELLSLSPGSELGEHRILGPVYHCSTYSSM